jgi:hypothetical protein
MTLVLLPLYLIPAGWLWVEMLRHVGGHEPDGKPRYGFARDDAPWRLAALGLLLAVIALLWILWFPLLLLTVAMGHLVRVVMPKWVARPVTFDDEFPDD